MPYSTEALRSYVYQRMEELGIQTLNSLAKKTGLSFSVIDRFITGGTLTGRNLVKIADALECRTDDIIIRQ